MSVYLHDSSTPITGYIGGAVVGRLLALPNFEITALIRSEEKAKKFKELGVHNVIVGDQTDYKKVEELAEGADVVLQMVSRYPMQISNGHLRSVSAMTVRYSR